MAKRNAQFKRTDNTAKRIEAVRFCKELEEYPDLSHLGEYSDTPEVVHIDRKERGDMGRNELRYFNAGCGDPAYIEQDYKRMEDYNRSEWCMTFCIAKAEVYINGIRQEITSGGLGGVESDSGDYFREIKREQLDELREVLYGLGFSKQAVTAAFAKCEDVEG